VLEVETRRTLRRKTPWTERPGSEILGIAGGKAFNDITGVRCKPSVR
jgi:hypothetical protein